MNYKSASFREDFKQAGYLDVFFDNVGGEILDFALTRLNQKARIVLCGELDLIWLVGGSDGLLQVLSLGTVRCACSHGAHDSHPYADSAKPYGITSYLNLISQRATIQGFIVYVPNLPPYCLSSARAQSRHG